MPCVTLPVGDARLVSALDAKMGLELLELTAERVVGRMPVDGNTQPFGLWHGGASCVLAETLASLGSYVHGAAGPDRGRGGGQRHPSPAGAVRLGHRHGNRTPVGPVRGEL